MGGTRRVLDGALLRRLCCVRTRHFRGHQLSQTLCVGVFVSVIVVLVGNKGCVKEVNLSSSHHYHVVMMEISANTPTV